MKAIVAYTPANTAVVPDSAMMRCRDPFFMPDNRQWQALCLFGVRIDRLGKGISPEFARRYYNECVIAIHPFAVSEPDDTAERWARDGALVVSESLSADSLDEELRKEIDAMISRVSRNATLKTGDLILMVDDDRSFDIKEIPSNHFVEPRSGLPGMKFKVR